MKIILSLLVIDHEGKILELKIDEFQRKNKASDASDSQVKHISIENERHKSGKTTRPVNDFSSLEVTYVSTPALLKATNSNFISDSSLQKKWS